MTIQRYPVTGLARKFIIELSRFVLSYELLDEDILEISGGIPHKYPVFYVIHRFRDLITERKVRLNLCLHSGKKLYCYFNGENDKATRPVGYGNNDKDYRTLVAQFMFGCIIKNGERPSAHTVSIDFFDFINSNFREEKCNILKGYITNPMTIRSIPPGLLKVIVEILDSSIRETPNDLPISKNLNQEVRQEQQQSFEIEKDQNQEIVHNPSDHSSSNDHNQFKKRRLEKEDNHDTQEDVNVETIDDESSESSMPYSSDLTESTESESSSEEPQQSNDSPMMISENNVEEPPSKDVNIDDDKVQKTEVVVEKIEKDDLPGENDTIVQKVHQMYVKYIDKLDDSFIIFFRENDKLRTSITNGIREIFIQDMKIFIINKKGEEIGHVDFIKSLNE
jgi:hypothetical protein